MSAAPTEPRDGLDAERARTILRAADALARKGGPDAVQMKAVAESSGVAIATLYRYFPSKAALLLALYHRRVEVLHEQVFDRPVDGSTPGERVATVLVGEFRLAQREHRLAEALFSAMNGADRSAGELLGLTHALHTELIERAATNGSGALSERQQALVQVAIAVYGSELTSWLRGLRSAEQAVAQIDFAALLLDWETP